MDWFRYHHGTQQDAKLTMIAKKIGVRRCEMTAVWDELMDYASRHVTRGHVTGCDLEVIAFTQDIEHEDVIKIYKALEEKGVIIDGCLKSWVKRQPDKEDNTATERKRRQRAKEKSEQGVREAQEKEKEVTEAVTPCHAMSRHVTTEEIRGEENIKKDIPNGISKKSTKTDEPNLEELSVEHIGCWLADKRTNGRYIHHDEQHVLEIFKNYCKSKGKRYKDYVSAYKNAFDWERCEPKKQPVIIPGAHDNFAAGAYNFATE